MEGVERRDAEAMVDGPAAEALLNVRRPKEAVSEESIVTRCLAELKDQKMTRNCDGVEDLKG